MSTDEQKTRLPFQIPGYVFRNCVGSKIHLHKRNQQSAKCPSQTRAHAFMMKLSKPHSPSSQLCALVFFITMISPFLVLAPLRHLFTPIAQFTPATPLTVVTLIYGQSPAHANIAHNCRMISATKHRYIVFTDDVSQSYCNVCECRLFVKRDCKCPDSSEKGCLKRNPCEKLLFLVDVLQQFKEVVLLDNDLVILKDYFLDRLQARAAVHDFLATYGHGLMQSTRYNRNFNSGLLFMRWLPGIHYNELEGMMYKAGANRDQGLISDFVQKHYENWDVLSWKWHCRQLQKLEQDIPYSHCYTLHDRAETPMIMKELNMSLLTI